MGGFCGMGVMGLTKNHLIQVSTRSSPSLPSHRTHAALVQLALVLPDSKLVLKMAKAQTHVTLIARTPTNLHQVTTVNNSSNLSKRGHNLKFI